MLRLEIICADSMGVRSMSHIVECGGLRIAIDPGAALAPRRYGLPPHPAEIEALEKSKKLVFNAASKADIIVITHYHLDHYIYEDEYVDAYKDKIVILKDTRNKINARQRRRGFVLKRMLETIKTRVIECNGGSFKFGDVELHLSPPVWHGEEGTSLGWVLMVSVKHGDESFVYCSDTQGPATEEALRWVLHENPSLIYLSGPPLYLENYKIQRNSIERALANTKKLITHKTVKHVVIDHHFARQAGYLNMLKEFSEELGKKVTDAAGYMGVERTPLESMRKRLWGEE